MRETRERREVWPDRGKRWRSMEPDHKRSEMQRDGTRGRGTDETETRALGKKAREKHLEREAWEMPREPVRRQAQMIGGRRQR